MKVCILGASGGLGSKAAAVLEKSGHEVIRCYRKGKLDSEKPSSKSRVAYISTNSLIELRASILECLNNKNIECIVNALGIGRSTLSPGKNIPIPTCDLTLEEWEEVIYVNLKIPILITELAQKIGIQRVIHIGSALTVNGLHGTAMAQAYSASKKGLFDYCAVKNGTEETNVTVACVAPGVVKTKMSEGRGLNSIFKGEMETEGVAEWLEKVLVNECVVNSVQLPTKDRI